MVGEIGYQKLAVAAALLVLFAVAGSFPAWLVTGAVALLLGVMCSLEVAG